MSTGTEGWAPLGMLRQEFGERASVVSRFVIEYAKRGVLDRACDEAGISQTTGRGWLSNPSAVRALHSCREWLFRTEGASTGYRVLVELANDGLTPANVRVQAAKTLLALGGHSEALAAQATAAGQAAKSLHDMDAGELERLIAGASATLQTLSRPVLDQPAGPVTLDVTPDPPDAASLL